MSQVAQLTAAFQAIAADIKEVHALPNGVPVVLRDGTTQVELSTTAIGYAVYSPDAPSAVTLRFGG